MITTTSKAPPPPSLRFGSDRHGYLFLEVRSCYLFNSRFCQILFSHSPGSPSSDLVNVRAWALEMTRAHWTYVRAHVCTCLTCVRVCGGRDGARV